MAISHDEHNTANEPKGAYTPTASAAGRQAPKTTPLWVKDDESVSPEEFSRLLDLYDNSFRNIAEGEVVKGTVLKVTENEVVIDVGYKSEGVIPVDEFLDETGAVIVRPGDVVDVLLERTEDRDGHIVLSREKAEKMKIWDEVERAFIERKVVIGRVVERIKGGLAVDIGVRAFLPGSQIDVRPVRNLDALKGQELRMRVIKVNKKRGNIVLSRKVVQEEQINGKKSETLKNLEEGIIVEGQVKNLTDYGAFIDLGGIDGLLHITDMSWGRLQNPHELLKIGETIQVKVLKFDRDKERVSLGLKQLTPDPWATAVERYPVNSRIKGKVVSLTDYGAFIELEAGIEGLVHVTEMSWSKRVKHPSKLLAIAQDVEAQVLEVDQGARRISLGLKQIEPNPWETLHQRYGVGTRIKGRVRNLTDFGAFIEIEEGIDGLVHVSDISWTKRIKHPSEALKKNQEVDAVITAIDVDNRRLSLSIKDLEPNAWERFFDEHRLGDIVTGKVTRFANFGAFVELEDGIEGLCHVSELSDQHVEKPEDAVKAGEAMQFKILKLDRDQRKIGLSARAVGRDEPIVDMRNYTSAEGGMASLGELAGLSSGSSEEES